MGDCGKGCLGGPGGIAGCDMSDPFGRGWSVGQDCVRHRFELGRPHIVAGSLLDCQAPRAARMIMGVATVNEGMGKAEYR